jgi:Ca2+-transporting ATPase
VTAVFLYESLAQLAFVYPARRITAKPVTNRILNWIVGVTIVLQLATVSLPGLRTVLGLSALDPAAFAMVAAALALSVLGANYSARHTGGTSP